MAEKKSKIDKRPPLGRNGGVRPVQRKLKTSETLYKNKEHIAAELLTLGTSSIMDIVNLDGTIKPLDQIPDYALRAIKKIQVTKDGVNIEMHDKVATLRVLAKAVGMLDGPEQNEDKPSIVGINMKGPSAEYMEVHDAEEEERKVSRQHMGMLMMSARMSPRELADRTGTTETHITEMLSGKRKPEAWITTMLAKQAKALKKESDG